MKYLKLLFPLLLLSLSVQAQPALYGNEWIRYNQTYHKFKIAREGIFRISKPALDAAGVPGTVTGDQLMLFRDGQEVPVHVTTNGTFGAGDYLEFYGTKPNGILDAELYASPSIHPDDRISMFTDTASYFLTWNTSTPHSRFQSAPNNIPGAPPPPPASCFDVVGSYYTNTFIAGKNIDPNQTFPSSIFDNAEGFVEEQISSSGSVNYSLNTPNAVAGGTATFNTGVIRYAFNFGTNPFKININNQLVVNSSIDRDETKRFATTFSSSLLTANTTVQYVSTLTGANTDVFGVSFLEIKYPRNFDCSGLDFFSFSLAPSLASQYLEFQNFNHGGNPPRLYDLTNKKYYSGNIAVGGLTRFYIEPSVTDRELVLYATNSSSIANVFSSKNFQFTDYTSAAKEGNYLIITHPALEQITSGHNYIDDYKNYRSSVTGGSFSVQVVDVTELYDQFAYGQELHPLAIKHFLQYGYYEWTLKPVDVFLIGRGLLYQKIREYLLSPASHPYHIVPTYGDPGADVDFVNFLPGDHQSMNIARLSAWNPQEIGNYLDKVKAFEAAIVPAVQPTYETEFWKKKALHIVGGSDAAEQNFLLETMNIGKSVIEDTLMGAAVITVTKNTTNPIDPVGNKTIDSLINNGISLLSFHGHATPNGFDFNLNDPELYHSAPRLPVFLAMGCDVAQIFSLNGIKTLSERYINAGSGGAINIIAGNNLGYPSFHRPYLYSFYKSVGERNYGESVGDHHHFAYDSIMSNGPNDFYFTQLESMLLQGDPAIRVFPMPKPDYHIFSGSLSSIPFNVTTNLDSFGLRIVGYNLGKAIDDTVSVKVEHINPAGAVTTVKTFSFINLYNADTAVVQVPINKIADLGLNKYRVTIDDNNLFDEQSETNNTGTFELFIYSDNLVPVYPYEFSIVSQQGITLKASTLNPFKTMGRYRLQIDTTELFNSPVKQETTVSSPGGVIKWTPSISFADSTVYYWRAAFDSAVNGSFQWSYSSFIYLAGSSEGWNQSHYYQYLKDGFTSLDLNTSRQFRFPVANNILTVSNAVYSDIGTTPWNTADFIKVMLNGQDKQRFGCPPYGGTLQVMVFDSVTNAPRENLPGNGTGAYPVCFGTRNKYSFEFPVYTKQGRLDAMHFLNDSIPNGQYVVVRNVINDAAFTPTYATDWAADISDPDFGGTSLYLTLKAFGYNDIDSFYKKRVFVFVSKKGSSSFPVYQFLSQGSQDKIDEQNIVLPGLVSQGSLQSTVIGPAKDWKTLKWRVSATDNIANDSPYVRIIGVDTLGAELELFAGTVKDKNLNFIDAAQYPKLKLEWVSYDSINHSSPQLNYWRVLYDPVPEAALNAAAHYVFTDSLNVGQMGDFSVAIENLTKIPMDSMLVRYKVINENGASTTLASIRYKKLPGEDTLHANLSFDPSGFAGNNIFFVEANPDGDQPEQYHPNNLGYIPFRVITDQRNPLIDVTFDGVHILDRDIVSAKPFIKIALKDENRYLALDDTSLISVSLRYPGQLSTSVKIPFDGTICKFIPGQAGQNNEAIIEFRPTFLEDGIYELLVNGRDKTGNTSAKSDYQVSFEVINRSTITNVLNYPNPFSTSTAFVFTMTGSQVPSQFKIQIMTVTGKVVREITRQEIGPLHVGRNITEYKWDGKDEYGQVLGNGVYFYRVVTAIEGNSIEHRESGADKFYKKGWGKMYIMR